MNEAVICGFGLAVIVMLVVAIIWQWAKYKLERWGYDLTKDTNRQLRETELKLDSILRGQERLDRAITGQTTMLNDLRSRLTSLKTGS
jgi:hypothetical protein